MGWEVAVERRLTAREYAFWQLPRRMERKSGENGRGMEKFGVWLGVCAAAATKPQAGLPIPRSYPLIVFVVRQ